MTKIKNNVKNYINIDNIGKIEVPSKISEKEFSEIISKFPKFELKNLFIIIPEKLDKSVKIIPTHDEAVAEAIRIAMINLKGHIKL